MVILIKILQVVLALSILVIVHEFGHFIFARIFKIRVEKFYLFFDAGFSLFKFKPKNSDTEYGMGWLPLGGYCRISGMVDESMDKEALKEEPKPWEYRSKPAWQRLFVITGGVMFNFILAVIIYSGILYTWGESYIKNSDVTTGIVVNDLAHEIGFRNGDKILQIGDIVPDDFNRLQIDLVMSQAKEAKVLRDGKTVTISIDPTYFPAMLKSPGMFTHAIPFVVADMPDSSINKLSGLKKGDKIVALNSTNTEFFNNVTEYLNGYKGDSLVATVARGNEIALVPLAVSKERKVEVIANFNLADFFTITAKEYTLLQSIPAGFNKTISTIKGYFKELKLIFSPKTEAYKSVGSFISIGKLFGDSWDWYLFWNRTAFLSVMLAVLNILPIPALDGGHMVFNLYEIITRRKPSDKFLEYAQMAGMILLLSIMVLAFGNDIRGLFN